MKHISSFIASLTFAILCSDFVYAAEPNYVRNEKEQPKPTLLPEASKYLAEIEAVNLAGAPGSLADCAHYKISFKGACLGVKLSQFTKAKRLSLVAPHKYLNDPKIYGPSAGDFPSPCQYSNLSFSFYDSFNATGFILPLGFTRVVCQGWDETFLGVPVRVEYVFINERLSSIEFTGPGSFMTNGVKDIDIILMPLRAKFDDSTTSPASTQLVKDRELMKNGSYVTQWEDISSRSHYRLEWSIQDYDGQKALGGWTVEIVKPEAERVFDAAIAASALETQQFINNQNKADL